MSDKRRILKCTRCEHHWFSRITPVKCPRCKSPYWDRPKTKRSGPPRTVLPE